jgi:hypothetical protein
MLFLLFLISRIFFRYSTMSASVDTFSQTVNPSTLNLSDYIAVPGKIIPIPGTEFVLISPVTPLTPPSAGTQASCEDPSPSHVPPPLSSQIKRRGRPFGKTRPCQCPNCQDMPGSDRHLCHFANCGKTFTKSCHLEAHLRNHMGAKPFQCPEPGCGVKFVRPDDLRRHSWKHTNASRFMCKVCGRRYYRKDHFKIHIVNAVKQIKSARRSGLKKTMLRRKGWMEMKEFKH